MDPLDIDIVLPRRAFDLRLALSCGAETLGLIGPSGAGKTSLLRTVAGLDHPTEGRVALGPEVWCDTRAGVDVEPEHRRVGYVPQDYALFPHLTVEGNVRFAGRRDRPDLLALVGITHLASARPGQLSGGERQRVALARALAREPGVMLLDEPFAALDAITRRQVRAELADVLSEVALPTLLVTHSFEDATALAARVGVIDRGRLIQLAPARELLTNPATATVAALTGANVVDGMASPSSTGAIVRVAGGGQLTTTAYAEGPVQIAVHPWELELGDPASSSLTDTVLSVSHDQGGVVTRLVRFTIQNSVDRVDRPAPAEGELVGLSVAPSKVRVFSAPHAAEASHRGKGPAEGPP